jgi:hypothetical protein
MTKLELQERLDMFEAAVRPFVAFEGALKMADNRKASAADIGISTEHLRAVVSLAVQMRDEEDDGSGE